MQIFENKELDIDNFFIEIILVIMDLSKTEGKSEIIDDHNKNNQKNILIES